MLIQNEGHIFQQTNKHQNLMRLSGGSRGGGNSTEIGLSSGNLQKQKDISGTIHCTQMADHFLETPEYEQFKYPGLVCLKVIKSVK